MKLLERIFKIFIERRWLFFVDGETLIVEIFSFGLLKWRFANLLIHWKLNWRRKVNQVDIEIYGPGARVAHLRGFLSENYRMRQGKFKLKVWLFNGIKFELINKKSFEIRFINLSDCKKHVNWKLNSFLINWEFYLANLLS